MTGTERFLDPDLEIGRSGRSKERPGKDEEAFKIRKENQESSSDPALEPSKMNYVMKSALFSAALLLGGAFVSPAQIWVPGTGGNASSAAPFSQNRPFRYQQVYSSSAFSTIPIG